MKMRVLCTSLSTLGFLSTLAVPAQAVVPEGRVCGKVVVITTDDPVGLGGSGRVTDVCLYTADEMPSAEGAITLNDFVIATTPSVCVVALPCVPPQSVAAPVPTVDPSKVVVAVPVSPVYYLGDGELGEQPYLCAWPIVFDNYGPGAQREVGISACARQEPVTVTSTSIHLAAIGSGCVDVVGVCTPPFEIAVPFVDAAVADDPIVVTPRLVNLP